MTMIKMAIDQRLLRLSQIEADSQLGKKKIASMIRNGDLPAVRIGKSIRVRAEDWLALLERSSI